MIKKRIQVKMRNSSRRSAALILAIVLLSGILIPFINASEASAITYNLITSRNIEMSDSNISDGSVTYQIGFYPGSSYTIKGIVVDFCATTPIINAVCTGSAPAGMNITTTPTVTTSGGVNVGLSGAWVAGYLTNGALNSILTLTSSTGTAVTSGTQIIFTLSGVTNTSALGTFYARILTYQTTAGATGYTPAAGGASAGGTLQDAGGIALSTVSQLTITSKVQEQITFCIDTNSAANCGVASGTAVLLGDTNDVLSTAGPFVDKTAQYIIQTNASQGAIIRIKGGTLTNGGQTIPAMTTAAVAALNNTSQFGMCTYESTGSNLTISTTPDRYDGGAGTQCSSGNGTQSAGGGTPGGAGTIYWLFNTANTSSTFGDPIATEAAGAQSTGTLDFMAGTSATQQAGIYSTTLTFIATGTF
jgi:hypothetical protein